LTREWDNIVPLNAYPFHLKSKKLPHSGHLNWSVLQLW